MKWLRNWLLNLIREAVKEELIVHEQWKEGKCRVAELRESRGISIHHQSDYPSFIAETKSTIYPGSVQRGMAMYVPEPVVSFEQLQSDAISAQEKFYAQHEE